MAQEEQINDNPVSTRQEIIKKYDVNRDGVFDANEINCIMDDYMFITQTNKALTDTNTNQKKLLSGTFLLIVLLTLSNLGTSFIAVNMSKEVVVVDGKIMANGGSQEEAISTMTSVRTLEKRLDGSAPKAYRRILTGETSPTNEGATEKVVCFTDDEVQKLFDNAKNGSGTNVVLKGSTSTAVISINGDGSFEEGVYTYPNGVRFVLDVNDICEGQTHGRSQVQKNRKLGPSHNWIM